MSDRERWNTRYRLNDGPTRPNERLARYKHLLKQGLALDLAGGIGQNSLLLKEWHIVLADLSDEALTSATGIRVQCEAPLLPFAPNSFDTIICTNFFEPRVEFASLLKPNGTLFFETMTAADTKYRPSSNPVHRFDPAGRDTIFREFESLLWEETDDGHRAFVTFIGIRR